MIVYIEAHKLISFMFMDVLWIFLPLRDGLGENLQDFTQLTVVSQPMSNEVLLLIYPLWMCYPSVWP